jgi:arylsulfatase A-like enzyme
MRTTCDTRRQFSRARRHLAFFIAALLLWLPNAGRADDDVPAESPTRPNVIIILADDLGYGDLSCYGHPNFKTPNLDRMAAEGARLTQFNTPAPFCAPTRASLLTGRYPFRCGMTANPAPDFGGQYTNVGLPATERTLAEVMHDAGYATAMVGKWHLGHAKKKFYPVQRGFEEYLGILYSNDMRPVQLIEGERVIEYPVAQATLTKRYTQRALDFLDRNKDRPFFLYFAHAMPHKPLAVSEDYYHKSGAGLYGDVMAELDASVGQVLARVKELGLDQNTLVVFTSDNGPWYGGSTGGLRGMKGTSWEGGYRVPFIARWPGRIPAGHESQELGITMDLFATVLKACNISLPSDHEIDGADLMPILTSKTAKSPHEVVLGQQGQQLATVRDDKWKLHVIPANERREVTEGKKRWIDPRAPDGVTLLAPYEQYQPTDYPGARGEGEPQPMALFNLADDPAEQHNVADENPDVVKRLKAQYDAVIAESPDAFQEPKRRKRDR